MNKYHVKFCLLLLVAALVLSACGQAEQKEAEADSVYEDVSTLVQEAEGLYQAENYEKSLDIYLTAMEKNPRDIPSRMGVVRSQIALDRIDLALMNLDMVQQLDPDNAELCRAYLDLADKTGRISYARTAISLAEQYDHQEILDLIPPKPVMLLEEGNYDSVQQLEITSDPELEIYVDLENSVNDIFDMRNSLYTGPVRLMRGTNTVTAYTMKDGIPSVSVTCTYTVDYPCVNVEFKEPLIEQLALQALNKESGPITNYECETLQELQWYDLQQIYTSYYEYEALRLHTLEDLKHFPGLLYLFLHNQDKITDYSPLQYCPVLFQLGIEESGLKNTDFAKYCPSVEHFNLGGNQIKDISGLIEKKNLYGVSLNGNNGKVDLTALIKAHPEMYRLEMNDDALSDYSILQELEEITSLYILGIQNVDRDGLSKLTELTNLHITMDYDAREYNMTFTDLSFLQNMPKLENLYLNGVSEVSDLEYIKGLENLEYLYLYNSPVADNSRIMEELAAALPVNCNLRY